MIKFLVQPIIQTISDHEMKFSDITGHLKSILNPDNITQLSKICGFSRRIRQITPSDLVLALLQVLGSRTQINLADIHRTVCANDGKTITYKPFHNKLKKQELTCLLQALTEQAAATWLLEPLQRSLPQDYPFKGILAHDGSSLKLHVGLKEQFPGRFTKTHPAAMELHMTLDVMSGTYEYLGLSADKESERHYSPFAYEIKDTLLLMDAGYFNIDYCHQASLHGGYVILRANKQINPEIQSAFDIHGRPLKGLKGKKLKQLTLQKQEVIDLTVSWKNKPGTHRMIAFWDKKKSSIGYLITNLDRTQFTAEKIVELYGLRWQIELFFKELKSYCGLKTVNTQDKHIVETLVWGSMLTLLLKRFIANTSAWLHRVIISTQKVARCAIHWLPDILQTLKSGQTNQIKAQLTKWCRYLSKNASRAHPKRDKQTLFMQVTCDPYWI